MPPLQPGTWLLTGGAGYIGAHVIRSLQGAGHEVVVVDDLSTGVRRKIPADVAFVRADVSDRVAMTRVLASHAVTGVVHLAAKKAVGESVEHPLDYYRHNVDGAVALAEAMVDVGVRNVVYSSSAAVYGDIDVDLVTEQSATVPVSPYGQTKLIGEWVFQDAAVAHGLSCVALRYFNVAGAGGDDLGDTGAFNLVPLALRAVAQGVRPQVFGADYPTPDGTCVRDYIHVADLAEAHAAAAEAAASAPSGGFVAYNIGRGVGASVLEVMAQVSRAVGRDIDAEVVGRRPGDPARVVGSVAAARDGLGWIGERDLGDMVTSAWSAWQAYPPT
ncbi:MAG TPA: UDP-glucose 4-epimerase GalE [Candidatus Nanopelagicales bacterium]|jgi:UDP-glucose 4-epimerase